jgi:hypothetical protein
LERKKREEGSKIASFEVFFFFFYYSQTRQSRKDVCVCVFLPTSDLPKNNLCLLEADASLLTHSLEDGDEERLLGIEGILDLLAELTIGELDVVLGLTGVEEDGDETVFDVEELKFVAGDVGDVHVVGGGAELLELLLGEDIDGNQVNLGVSVLSGLGGGHLNNLAGPSLDDDVASLAKGRALHGEGGGSDVLGGLKGLLVVGHCDQLEERRRRRVRYLLMAMGGEENSLHFYPK